MSHDFLVDGEIRRQTVVEGDAGQHDIVLLERYVGPNPETISEAEKLKAVYDFDIWRARAVKSMLMATYPGHLWAVEHDLAQGVCKIKLALLMAVTRWYSFNLGTHGDLTTGMVIAAGGELLERYNLRRGRLELASFLEAREKYSGLVDRRRPVPA